MVLDPFRIALRYLRTWCIVDVIVVLPDWFFTISAILGEGASPQGSPSSMRLIRVLRLVRLARLLLLLRLRKAWSMLYDFIDSEKVGIVLNVVQMVVVLVVVNHFVACAWFLVG